MSQALKQAAREGRVVVLWGEVPFALADHPPAHPVPVLNDWAAQAREQAPSHSELVAGLPELPPLPILSLDPGNRLEHAFRQASVPLEVVRGRRDVPVQGRHNLLKLAGDLDTRSGVVLSRAEVRDLHSDPGRRYLLGEARRRTAGGALLLLGCDPASQDFAAWWAVLAPAFRDAALFALGDPSAPWPVGITCLGPKYGIIRTALRAVRPSPEPEAEKGERPMPRRIDPANVPYKRLREFLQTAFTPGDLRRFCQDYPKFGSLLTYFGPNDGINEMLDELFDYLRTKFLWEDFLDALAVDSPGAYNVLAGQMGWPEVEVPETEAKPAKREPETEPSTTEPEKPPYDDVEIHVHKAAADGHYPVYVHTQLAGDTLAPSTLKLPWTDESLRDKLLQLEAESLDLDSMAEMGKELFQALFQGDARDHYMEARGTAKTGLRLRLRFDPDGLQALPWELLYDAKREEFLALSGKVLITRYLPLARPVEALAVKPPLVVLVATSEPVDQKKINVDAEATAVKAALAPLKKEVRIHVLAHTQLWTLRDALRDLKPHVLHFVGHGNVDAKGGVLMLEDPNGKSDPLPASKLAMMLKRTDVRLAVLNACLSARGVKIQAEDFDDQRRGVLGVGPALVKAGLGAVVAYQFSISNNGARLFAQDFYRTLARLEPMDEAVSRAREALALASDEDSRDWGTPILFLRAPDGVIFKPS